MISLFNDVRVWNRWCVGGKQFASNVGDPALHFHCDVWWKTYGSVEANYVKGLPVLGKGDAEARISHGAIESDRLFAMVGKFYTIGSVDDIDCLDPPVTLRSLLFGEPRHRRFSSGLENRLTCVPDGHGISAFLKERFARI